MILSRLAFMLLLLISFCSCGRYGKLYNETVMQQQKQDEEQNISVKQSGLDNFNFE